MPLRIVFSWFADAGAWPEHPGAGLAAVDHAIAGPLRLLDHLETMLGLGAPNIASTATNNTSTRATSKAQLMHATSNDVGQCASMSWGAWSQS